MPGLDGEMVVELVAEVHILYLHFVVCEIQVEFGEPFLEKFRLYGEACPAYAHPVAEAENPVILLQVLVQFGGKSLYGLCRDIEGGVRVYPVVEPQPEFAVMIDVERAVCMARCGDIVDRLPLGLKTRIGAGGTYLSGPEFSWKLF